MFKTLKQLFTKKNKDLTEEHHIHGAKIAEEFYQMAEWLRTKDDTEEVLNDFLDRELGDILDCVESRFDEDHFWEMYVTQRIEEMMFRYGDIKVCGFYPDQERLRSIIDVEGE